MKYLLTSVEAFSKGIIPDWVKEFLKAHKNPFIILDESSKIKTTEPCANSKKSKRTQGVLKLNTTGHRCFLTGTFMSKSPVNAYDQMGFIYKNFFGCSIFAFAEKTTVRIKLPIGRGISCVIDQKTWDYIYKKLHTTTKEKLPDALSYLQKRFSISIDSLRWIYAHKEYTPFKHVQEEVWDKISPFVSSLTKEEALPYLPSKVYKRISVPLSSHTKKLYTQLLKTHFTDKTVCDNSMSLYHQLQDICNGYEPETTDDGEVLLHTYSTEKLDVLKSVLESIDVSQNQVVVWASRKQFLRDIYSFCRTIEGVIPELYDGDTLAEERIKIENRFAENKINVLCINQATGAYGLDCLKNASYAIYMCSDYSAERRSQSEDRIDRFRSGDNLQSKIIIDIFVEGTVEEKVLDSLQRGKDLITSRHETQDVFDLDVPRWTDGTEAIF